MLKSMWYATRDRRVRKRDLRKLWIARINAAARLNGTTYSRLVAALKKANITAQPQDAGRHRRARPEGFRRRGGTSEVSTPHFLKSMTETHSRPVRLFF